MDQAPWELGSEGERSEEALEMENEVDSRHLDKAVESEKEESTAPE